MNCFCGSPASLRSNSVLYGREYGNGKAYICNRFPACRGSVGTHPNGRPLGSIADPETKALRMEVHAKIDPIWKVAGLEGRAKREKRKSVYQWLAKIMNVREYHTGNLTAEQCRLTLQRIAEQPYLSPHPNNKETEDGKSDR